MTEVWPPPDDLEPEFAQPSSPIGRRAFLGLAAVGALSLAFGARASETTQKLSNATKKVPGLSGINDILPLGEQFRIYTVTDGYPHRSRARYRLEVGGLVDRPLQLSYADLQSRPATRLTKDFQCVTGWRVHDVKWTGVKVADILDEAGVQPQAKAITFTSFDGVYTESLTLDQARRSDVIVAYQMLGGDISDEHGGPVRLYVAPMYGYKSCKWLSGMQVVDRVQPGYWEELGYDVDAWVGESNGRNDDATS